MHIRTRKVTRPTEEDAAQTRNGIIYSQMQQEAAEQEAELNDQASYADEQSLNAAQKLTAYEESINFSNTEVQRNPLSITALEQQNEQARVQMQEKMRLVEHIEPMMDEITTLTAELQRVREQQREDMDEVLRQVNQIVTSKYGELNRKIEHTAALANSMQTKSDSLFSREQLRDNIINIHDEALTNYSQVLQKMEQKIAELDARSIGKDELNVRIKNLEHDVKQMWAELENQNVAVQQEMNGNVSNIMGILGILEQKSKSVQLQLDEIRMLK